MQLHVNTCMGPQPRSQDMDIPIPFIRFYVFLWKITRVSRLLHGRRQNVFSRGSTKSFMGVYTCLFSETHAIFQLHRRHCLHKLAMSCASKAINAILFLNVHPLPATMASCLPCVCSIKNNVYGFSLILIKYDVLYKITQHL